MEQDGDAQLQARDGSSPGRMRLLAIPLLLTVAGAALVGLGLMESPPSVEPPDEITIRASDAPVASGSPSSRPPIAQISPLPGRPDRRERVPTRVEIPALKIDLPIIAQPGGPASYPPCDVAMYLRALSVPGYGGATYLYAHAREGMFLPILEASLVDNGRAMLGMTVRVYTSDDQLFTYRVSEIHRHVPSLAPALAVRDEELWLQTSEGPAGTIGKLELVAEPVSSAAAPPGQARPTPRPRFCA
jgi:hypothetical protein